MNPAALIAGIAIGAALTGTASADVSLDSIDARVTQLESNASCVTVAPLAPEQLHGTTKTILVTTNSGPQTLAHPSRFVWLYVMRPSCAEGLS